MSELLESINQTFIGKLHLKTVIVCDEDVVVSDWNDVIWAITTRMDPSRDTHFIQTEQQTPQFILMDATNKLEGETFREWGHPIKKDPQVVEKIDQIWDELNIL